jgi:hypothetical protein
MTSHVPERCALLVFAVAALGIAAVVHAQQTGTSAAQASVEKWLALVDAQSYDESWDAAASIFKAALPREQWVNAVTGVRTPLGTVKARKPLGRPTPTSPPNAPAGEYIVFQFETGYEKRPTGAVETVTAFKEADGTWRVAGYFVK